VDQEKQEEHLKKQSRERLGRDRVEKVIDWLLSMLDWASADPMSRLSVVASEISENSEIICRAIMEAIDERIVDDVEEVIKYLSAIGLRGC
jgi:Ser-tRNA(Ala) deacylase AlaX